jgi:hypothetical protein
MLAAPVAAVAVQAALSDDLNCAGHAPIADDGLLTKIILKQVNTQFAKATISLI